MSNNKSPDIIEYINSFIKNTNEFEEWWLEYDYKRRPEGNHIFEINTIISSYMESNDIEYVIYCYMTMKRCRDSVMKLIDKYYESYINDIK